MYDTLVDRVDSNMIAAVQLNHSVERERTWLFGLVRGYFEAGKIAEIEYNRLERYIADWKE